MLLDSKRTLLLNADYRPLTTMPLSTFSWQEAVTSVLSERVNVVEEYEEVLIRSQNFEMFLPSVVSLKQYIKIQDQPKFTRLNIFVRDNFTCQYCLKRLPTTKLTFDHVVPISRGGTTGWQNITTACNKCNTKKGNKLCSEIKMWPKNKPHTPDHKMLKKGISKSRHKELHRTWLDYVYWDSDLEE